MLMQDGDSPSVCGSAEGCPRPGPPTSGAHTLYLASKPMSRSLSASSSTSTSKLFTQLARSRPSAFLRNMSSRRPGVATMMCPLWKESPHLPVHSGAQKHGRLTYQVPSPQNHLNPWQNDGCRVGTARAGRKKDDRTAGALAKCVSSIPQASGL